MLLPLGMMSGCGGSGSSVSTPDSSEVGGGTISGRYQVMGTQSEIIRDLVTGLEWQRCAVGQTWSSGSQTCSGTAAWYDWDTAVTLTAPGGFRLPTKEELRTLIYCSNTGNFDSNGNDSTCGTWGTYNSPTIDEGAFPNVPSRSWFWSSSPYAGSTSHARLVYFGYGSVDWSRKDTTYRVRLVRVGQ